MPNEEGELKMLWLVLLCAVLFSAEAAEPSTPSMKPDDYGLFRRIPDDCSPNTTCSYFVGLRVNTAEPTYLDVYLSGSAMGWVAIGYSPTNNMDNSDVLGCSVETSTANVRAIDTYNDPDRNSRSNLLDSSGQLQQDIMEGSMVFEDGRITCSFSRLIAGLDGAPSDFNLDGDYFFLFGRGNVGRSSAQLAAFPRHEMTPSILGVFNPVRDAGELHLMPSGPGAGVPAGLTTPDRLPADYRLRRRDPSGCDPESCDQFMGISTNSENNSFLDFYLTADINGWVAVGFSRSSNMQDADVLGCKRDSASDEVFAIDTYNIVDDRLNSKDNNGNIRDIVRHGSSFRSGRITCIFSRRIIGDDEAPEDKNLDEDYFLMFGLGNRRDGTNFPNHIPLIPQLSDGKFNPSTDGGEIRIIPQLLSTGISCFQLQLLQAHGILMLITIIIQYTS